MATYTFSFPASAAGKPVSVKDAAGDEVATATAPAPADVQSASVVSVPLPVGDYTATAVDAKVYFSSHAKGVLDERALLATLEESTGTVAGRVAEAVDPASETFAEDLIAALVAAGLMADGDA